jgi:hypothetical protein
MSSLPGRSADDKAGSIDPAPAGPPTNTTPAPAADPADPAAGTAPAGAHGAGPKGGGA